MNKLSNLLFLSLVVFTLNGCASGMGSGRSSRFVIATVEAKTSGYDYLFGKQEEEGGYGLYSYLLFESRPSETNRNFYLEAIKAIIKDLDDVKELEDQGFSREKLNVTYVLIKKPLPSGEGGPSPEWVLKNYNYARAKFFLSKLPGERTNGPYIVSTLHPISRFQESPGPKDHLVQDLSRTPPNRTDLIHASVKAFLRQASRPKEWNRKSGEDLARDIRLAIAIAAEGLPQVQEAIKTWVVWVKDLGSTRRPEIEMQVPFYMLEA